MSKKYLDQPYSYLENLQEDFKILIVTATEVEKKQLHSRLTPLKVADSDAIVKIVKGKHTYFLGMFGAYHVVHVACDMGSTGRNASITTVSEAIQTCSPKIVLMVGIAFGMNSSKQKIGDILVSDQIIAYESQRVSENNIDFRGKSGDASSLLINHFNNVMNWEYKMDGKRKPNIIVGAILSGEKLVDNEAYRNILLEKYPNAKGGEMEGAGVYAACDGKSVEWILVKGICDFADGNKNENKESHQKKAIQSAVNLCEHVFKNEYAFDDIGVFTPERLKNKEKKKI
jgi:nucleoside phosphorylase